MATPLSRPGAGQLSILARLGRISWPLVMLLTVTASIGFICLYSAAGGSLEPWATQQITRFLLGLLVLVALALVDLRFWMRYAYLFYIVAFGLLIAVELAGTGTGAQRWIGLGGFRLQPSEIMKVALVLALARWFHRMAMEDIGKPHYLIVPLALILAPAGLVLRQPDLGTALTLVLVGGAVFFLAGVRVWKFVAVTLAALAAIPVAWSQLRDYQKDRILTFLEPERDPLGAGYHILQSQIALGSGGVSGKGFLQGTQAHLNFLPEQQTDFIFTILAEEFGILGGIFLLLCYGGIIIWGMAVAARSRNQFGRVLAMGLAVNFFLYAFINMAMVMGLLPVVGVPLPMVSYGGTVMLTLMAGFGLMMSVHVNRDLVIRRREHTD